MDKESAELYDSTAVAALRQAGRASVGRSVQPTDLLRAIENPLESDLPKTNLKLSGSAKAILCRAGEIANDAGSAQISRIHMYEALLEAVPERHAQLFNLRSLRVWARLYDPEETSKLDGSLRAESH